jgi:hypothetical protein
MTEPVEDIRVRLPLSVWRALNRFCRYHDLAESEYVAWLVGHTAGSGRTQSWPLPPIRDAEAMQRCEEA